MFELQEGQIENHTRESAKSRTVSQAMVQKVVQD